jgi:hypothetical protein
MAQLETSQLGIAQLGLLQLGMVEPNGGSPPVTVPDVSTWFIAMSAPQFPKIEIEAV